MLTEERFNIILKCLEEKNAVTVGELTGLLNASESTIRRDLTALHDLGKLKKVHGGATLLDTAYIAQEENMNLKAQLQIEEKKQIAKQAARLIEIDDFVYLDAGSTTLQLVEALPQLQAAFVTNGTVHGQKLAQRGFKVYMLGGQLKPTTEAVIGAQALHQLQKYNFTKCFLGANGIALESGYTTPDVEEALLKEAALKRSQKAYILADDSKFDKKTAISFGALKSASIITNQLPDTKYRAYTQIEEAAYDLYCNL